MSSIRNAVQRRPHRERAQPLERRHLGLLEKHKDYALRAKDYNKKKETLRSLRQRASERNDDEFYFGMMSRKGPGSRINDGRNWTGTVDVNRGNKGMDVETVRLLKTQDMGYIRTMRQVTAKELARLEQKIILTRGFDHLAENEVDEEDCDEDSMDRLNVAVQPKARAPRKIVFLEDEEEREEALANARPEESRAGPGADESQREEDDEHKEDEDDSRAGSLRRLRHQCDQARKRLQALADAENELAIQQAHMAKTATSGGHTRRGGKIRVRRRKR